MKRLASILVIIICIVGMLISCDNSNTNDTVTPSVINVSITAVANPNNSFTVSTNLPDGTSLMLTLSADNYSAQDEVCVYNGKATSSVFTDNGSALSGTYKLDVVMPAANIQSQSVKDIIGDNGEYLSGDLVKPFLNSKVVESTFEFSLKAPKSELDIIKETPFNYLTKSQKLTIIYWIEARYDYYDNLEGKYVGDKYTKTIFNEAAERYNKTYEQIDDIWYQAYKLKYN